MLARFCRTGLLASVAGWCDATRTWQSTLAKGHRLLGKKSTNFNLAANLLFVISVAFAVTDPLLADLGVTLLVGWLLIFDGFARLVAAFRKCGAHPILSPTLIGIAYLAAGFYCVKHPLLPVGPAMFPLRNIFVWSRR